MRFQETVMFTVLLMPQLIILLEYSWYSKLSLFLTLYSSILPLIYLLIHPVLSILIGNTESSLKVSRLGLDTFTAMVQLQSLAKEIRSQKPCSSAKKKKKKKEIHMWDICEKGTKVCIGKSNGFLPLLHLEDPFFIFSSLLTSPSVARARLEKLHS